MSLQPPITGLLAAAAAAAGAGAEVPADAGSPVLLTLDTVIRLAGLAIAVASVGWWLARSRRDPLATAPDRTNRLPPEMLILALFAYMGTGLLILTLLGSGDGVDLQGDAASKLEGGTVSDELERVRLIAADAVGRAVGVAVCLILVSRWFDGGVRRFFFGARGVWSVLPISVATTIVALALCDITLRATMLTLRAINPEYEFLEHDVIRALREGLFPAGVVFALQISAGVVAPLAEEVFFRGLLQTILIRLLKGRWLPLVLVSVAFALVHVHLHVMPALFVLAMLMGFAYERTGSLIAPILVHAMFNGKTLLWEALGAGSV